eukprot:TRINITY_DN13769_c0_g4_i1.p1 TRINITY_DN13769_c0_g4~~TRINITY_DN13769_c0_g4_i1.p1  ORF type:complete len:370 (+),score=68.99 TRINITY_DN13769_c0_g4_i1:258-1367(+)
MHRVTSVAISAAVLATVGAELPSELEILFEPLDSKRHKPDVFFNRPSLDSKEAALDNALSSLIHDTSSTEVSTSDKHADVKDRPQHSSFPIQMIRDLFPGPWLFGRKAEHPVPFEQPDPLVKNLMQGLDTSVVSLLDQVQAVAGRDRLPNSCNSDVATWCQGAPSHLHCLGQHADVISDACRSDVGKSVPFRCSSSIDSFCNTLEVGILDCLGARVIELPQECRDAVLATHHVLSKASSHKVSVVDLTSGMKQQVVPGTAVKAPAPIVGAPHAAAAPHELPKGVLDILGAARSVEARSLARVRGHPWQTLCVLTVLVAAGAFYFAAGSSYEKRLHSFFVSLERRSDDSDLFKSEFELSQAIEGGFTAWP